MMGKLPPTILVIFGITGDLSHRYLLPALAEICQAGQLSSDFKVLGVSRRKIKAAEVFRESEKTLLPHADMLTMNVESLTDYEGLKTKINELAKETKSKPQIIFYLMVPPTGVPTIIEMLGSSGLNKWSKLMLEKPFGTDLASANELVTNTEKHFKENQVYRIDHYLAKEMAQNITVFLSSNSIFRDVWSNKHIEKIEIVVAEKISVEGRATFYEGTGALRDMVQSHLLQLAALTLMEPCSDIFDFEEIPRRRQAALEALRPVNPKKVHKAQYQGYSDEVGVPGSSTETFVDLTIESGDKRWIGVPIRLTTGKNLNEKLTEIRIYFKKTTSSAANLLVLRIQPREGIELDLWVKEPGYERKLKKLPLSFAYGQHFKHLPDAYEQVLIDAMRSNQSLFASSREVLASWAVLEPVLNMWEKDTKLASYKPGSTIEEVLKIGS